jgi:hypothetical protein
MVGRGWWVLAAVGVWTVTACGGSDGPRNQVRQTASVAPTLVPGNPSCPEGFTSLKIEPVEDGTYSNGDFEVTIDIEDDGTLSFDANQGVDQVIVKGGPNANVYAYDPEVTSDVGLITPTNPNNGQPYGYSHVDFCYDDEPFVPLEITKTATARETVRYVWGLDKEGGCPELGPLPQGGEWLLAYWVTLNVSSESAGWVTTGEITITNPNDDPATITEVTDLLDSVAADVDCGVTFPYELAAGGSLVCDYSLATATEPSENTATVETSGDIEGNTVTVAVDLSSETDATDECITLTDSLAGELGTVCADDPDLVIEYTFLLTSAMTQTCGSWDLENTATLTTNDTQTQASDTFVTEVFVRCENPCPTEPMLQALCVQQQTALLVGSCPFPAGLSSPGISTPK